jgi:hypothetical protein
MTRYLSRRVIVGGNDTGEARGRTCRSGGVKAKCNGGGARIERIRLPVQHHTAKAAEHDSPMPNFGGGSTTAAWSTPRRQTHIDGVVQRCGFLLDDWSYGAKAKNYTRGLATSSPKTVVAPRSDRRYLHHAHLPFCYSTCQELVLACRNAKRPSNTRFWIDHRVVDRVVARLVSNSCGEAPFLLSLRAGVRLSHSFWLHALEEWWRGQDDEALSFWWSILTQSVLALWRKMQAAAASAAAAGSPNSPISKDDNDHHRSLLYFFCSLRYADHDLQASFVSVIIQKRRRGSESAQRDLFPMQLCLAVVHFTYSCVNLEEVRLSVLCCQ